jgi:hypothetical protein
MTTTPNYEKPTASNGVRYFWVSADALACHHLGLSFGPHHMIALHTRKPKTKDKYGKLFKYHRVKLEVVRTAKECAALDRKWKRSADKNWLKFQKAIKDGRS